MKTLEMAAMAGLPADLDEAALFRFADLCVKQDRAALVIQSRSAEAIHRHEANNRIGQLESRVRGLDRVVGALTSYVGEKEGDSCFMNDFIKRHVDEQKRKSAQYKKPVGVVKPGESIADIWNEAEGL